MVIEDEVTSNRNISNTNTNTNADRSKTPNDNIDSRFIQEQIAKVFNIWSDISKLPAVGPSFAYSQNSRSDLKELIEFGKSFLELQIHLSQYCMQINNTYVQALAKASEKAPKQYNSREDLEKYRKVVIDVFEDAFTGLYDSKEFASLYGLLQSNQFDLLMHLQKLTENNLKALNLPTRSDIDDMSKDIHDLKKTVHDLIRKIEVLKINESGNLPY
ncbi:MAG TPA: poly(R)-hydroxyalkanoic acid synthase subunit PhaE [Candidatus Bathyarchaeia archaeon]|nr:poly(R)-hydroxyalkanoic acid synthase subunit PhaE [Candidatus Bathyarchaeia archaeon]